MRVDIILTLIHVRQEENNTPEVGEKQWVKKERKNKKVSVNNGRVNAWTKTCVGVFDICSVWSSGPVKYYYPIKY